MNDQTLQQPITPVPRDRIWPMMAHLSAYAMFVVPFGNIIGPLVVWLAKRDEDSEVDRHGSDSLNFQITYLLINLLVGIGIAIIAVAFGLSAILAFGAQKDAAGAGIAAGGILSIVIIGCFFGGYAILNWILIAVNSVRAYDGRPSVYFPTIKFVKPHPPQQGLVPPTQPVLT